MLPLLLLLLQNAVAFDSSTEGTIFERALEDLASESLHVHDIQVREDSFQYSSSKKCCLNHKLCKSFSRIWHHVILRFYHFEIMILGLSCPIEFQI